MMSFFIGSWALGNTSIEQAFAPRFFQGVYGHRPERLRAPGSVGGNIWIPYRKVTKENYKSFMK